MSDLYLLEFLSDFKRDLRRIESKLDKLIKQGETMSAELDSLTQAVQNEDTVVDSAITLLNQLSALIQAHVNDPAALTALAQEVNQKASDLANAVTANTPATP